MSTKSAIDDEVRRFVVTSIPSVVYLEAALLFRRKSAPKSVEDVAQELYIPETASQVILEALRAAGVLVQEGGTFRYAPRDERLAAMLGRLAQAYAADLIGITNLIHDKTHRNARRFADAFRLRKDS